MDEADRQRALAEKLLREKFEGNKAALARALGIHATRITTFLVHKKGGLSSRTALCLTQLAGEPAPTPRKSATGQDDELEKVLDFFNDRWPPEVQTVARMLVAHRGVSMSRTDWIEKLDEIESCVGDLVERITK